MRVRILAAGGAAGVAAAVAALAAGLGSAAPPDQTAIRTADARVPVASRPTTRDAWTARILYPVPARRAPRTSARARGKISPQAAYNKGPQILLVLAARRTRQGLWYRLRLPTRPNTASAWVPAEAVQVRRTVWRVRVDVSARRAELFRAGRRVGRWRVVVGRPRYPTPTGRFAISEVVRQRNPSGFFGPAIITMTAHSTRLNDFDGGKGRAALHGTSLPGLLGTAASHGCVRFANGAIRRIARSVPPGSPLDIVP